MRRSSFFRTRADILLGYIRNTIDEKEPLISDISMKIARENHRKECEQALYKDVLAQLEDAIALKDLGKNEDADAIVNGLKAKLENMIHEEEARKNSCQIREFDRTIFPAYGELLSENDKVILRVIQPTEKDDYLSVSYDYSCMKSAFKEEKFKEELWNDFMSENAFVCTIIDSATGSYVGYCSIKDLRKVDWEIAIELKSEWCHKGYGTEALSLFMKKIASITGNRFFRVRVDIDNYASQALMRKLGAYPNGVSEFLLKGEELERFKKENIDLIDDKIRAVADEFCMDPEDILGLVLEYRFDMLDNF